MQRLQQYIAITTSFCLASTSAFNILLVRGAAMLSNLTECAPLPTFTPAALVPLEPILPFGFLPRIYESRADRYDNLRLSNLHNDPQDQLELKFSCNSTEADADNPKVKEHGKKPDGTNVVFLAPRTFHPILDKHFPSWVVRERKLRKLADCLEDHGVIFVGQVVQYTRLELHTILAKEQYTRRRDRIDCLEHLLSDCELRLNMTVPGWTAPSENSLYPE